MSRAGRHTKELAQTVVDAGPSKISGVGVGAEDSIDSMYKCLEILGDLAVLVGHNLITS